MIKENPIKKQDMKITIAKEIMDVMKQQLFLSSHMF